MLKAIINILNRIIPKSNKIIFNSFPNVSGNVLSVYDELVNRHSDLAEKYNLVWIINNNEFDAADKLLKNINHNQKYIICKKKSIKGIWLYCRSKYILTTHNYITGVNTYGEQKNYNLWHGMPFKTIGKMMDNTSEKDYLQGDYTIATSPIFQEIMANSFGLSKEKVFITGQSCNDQLFHTKDALKKVGICKDSFSKIIMWMPTYRKSIVGAIHEDGDINCFGVSTILNEYFSELNNLLIKRNYLLLIKPHPMDVINSLKLSESNNIRVIHDNDFEKYQVFLYEVLGETDVLLTDYSSVFIDYLNIDKPIAFVFDDIDRYEISRGFNFENPLEYMPGEKITSFSQFMSYFNNMDEINLKWQEQRRKIAKLFNQYSDCYSAERIVLKIFCGQ